MISRKYLRASFKRANLDTHFNPPSSQLDSKFYIATTHRIPSNMPQDAIKIIFGTFPMNTYTPEQTQEILSILKEHSVTDIDTAAGYPDSELLLGKFNAAQDFTIHTKAKAFVPGSLARRNVLGCCLTSLFELHAEQVDTYFLHSPDAETPLEETLSAINELYQAGKFKRFGLSNFLPEQVQEAYDVAKAKGWVLPTVYQGNYNPVARRIEADLFPVLRKLGIAFFAYSPLAGGFLTKTAEDVHNGAKGGRFDKESRIGQMYQKLYNKPSLLEALEKWERISDKSGISKAALAYRWVTYNSYLKKEHGDGIILGASRPHQLLTTLQALNEGPLPESVEKEIDEIWNTVKDEAPLDNFNY